MKPTAASRHPTIVLAAVDPAVQADDVLRTAGLLAQMLVNAELHLVRVVDPPAAPIDGVAYVLAAAPALDALVEEAREEVATLAKEASAFFAGPTTPHVTVGSPGKEIVALAEALNADVVVVGSEGKEGVRRLLLGSVSEHVARHAPCSVLVARPRHDEAEALIEPICPDCAAVRLGSRGERTWCERHAAHHPHGALHYQAPASFGVGSMFIRPAG
jgi:nucleotide-binding universal stress UspA family protein